MLNNFDVNKTGRGHTILFIRSHKSPVFCVHPSVPNNVAIEKRLWQMEIYLQSGGVVQSNMKQFE